MTKSKEQRYLISYPNCIGTEQDYKYPPKGGIIIYDTEDEEKMKDMTTEEKIAYKRQLRAEGKYREIDTGMNNKFDYIMRQKVLWLDLALCSVWALAALGNRSWWWILPPHFLMLFVFASRIALSFVLYRGEKRGWVTLATFVGLTALPMCSGDNLVVTDKLICSPFYMFGIEYDRIAHVTIGYMVAAWLWVMPLVVYIVALCRKKLTRTELTTYDLLGGILWHDKNARTYSLLVSVAVMALFSGLAMNPEICWYVCLGAPMLSFWLLCRYYQVKADRLWLMLAAMAVFYYAQTSYGIIRIALLGTSLALVAYLCSRFYKAKGMLTLSIVATLYFGILLPSLTIGNNQYTCVNYPRQGFYTLESYPGIFFVKNPQTGDYGLRDRYGLLVAPEYDEIIYHTPRHYWGTLELRKNGYYTLYDICDNKMSKVDDIDQQLQDSICLILGSHCRKYEYDYNERLEIKVTELSSQDKLLSHVKMQKNGNIVYYDYTNNPYISADTTCIRPGELMTDSLMYTDDNMKVFHYSYDVNMENTTLFHIDINTTRQETRRAMEHKEDSTSSSCAILSSSNETQNQLIELAENIATLLR